MWSRNQRQNAARLFLRRLTLLALLGLVFLGASSVLDVYSKERESKKLRLQAETERADLLLRQTQLELDIAQLRTDRGLEEALREQFALAEWGERLIVIVDPPTPELIRATSTIREWFKKAFWWF